MLEGIGPIDAESFLDNPPRQHFPVASALPSKWRSLGYSRSFKPDCALYTSLHLGKKPNKAEIASRANRTVAVLIHLWLAYVGGGNIELCVSSAFFPYRTARMKLRLCGLRLPNRLLFVVLVVLLHVTVAGTYVVR